MNQDRKQADGDIRPAVTDQMRTLLKRAVELRAGGQRWSAVAEELHRKETTCRKWPSEYRETWDSLYREAHTAIIDEAHAEALHVQRSLLRHQDPSIRQRAAHSLLHHVVATQPTRLEMSGADGGPVVFRCILPGLDDEDEPAEEEQGEPGED